MKKASIEQLSSAYSEHQNIWKVAEIFGMCGQSVWERLIRHGIINSMNVLSNEDKRLIKEFYEAGFETGDGKLKEFALKIKRTVPFISRYAKSIFLSQLNRKICEEQVQKSAKNLSETWRKNGHPRGMLGKTHTKENCEKIRTAQKNLWSNISDIERSEIASKSLETRRKNGNDKHSRGSWKANWRTIGGQRKFFRSSWEANYGRYLQSLKEKGEIKDWLHEPQTFWFLEILRGTRSYLPDFKVMKNDGTHYWCEVKGWMCPSSITKIKRFHKYYPEETLLVVGKEWFKENGKKLSERIEGWEKNRGC